MSAVEWPPTCSKCGRPVETSWDIEVDSFRPTGPCVWVVSVHCRHKRACGSGYTPEAARQKTLARWEARISRRKG